ncbi:MAG: class I SAM-dependent methyltransferase [Candidatus Omnitrophota bacterium]
MTQQTDGMEFWEKAGEAGYLKAYGNSQSYRYVTMRIYDLALQIADRLVINENSSVLDIGCGDGLFSKEYLSKKYRHVTGYDFSHASIESAKTNCPANIHFERRDVSQLEFDPANRYDAAFLVGILHHVKKDAPGVIQRLSQVCPKIIVLEPVRNIIRILLECLPVYKEAGEDSFYFKDLCAIFHNASYRMTECHKIGFVPNFLPDKLLPLFKIIESIMERNRVLGLLCSVRAIGLIREE